MSANLILDKLSFSYQSKDGASAYTIKLDNLCLDNGKVMAITGPSGCGKSTLLECLALLRNFECNSYSLATFNLKDSQIPISALRAGLIGFMPQTGGLIPYLTVSDNLKLQIKIATSLKAKYQGQKADEKALYEEALALLKEFSLLEYLNYYPHQLSIGQRQRVVFFKSICHEPKLLLIDEPTSALDPYHGQLLFETICKVCTLKNLSSLVVTHDLNLVTKFNLDSLDYQRADEQTGVFL